MTDPPLTEEDIYEAADLTQNSVSLDRIRSVEVAAQIFSNFDILTQLSGLEILSLRACGLTIFPEQIFVLQRLRSLDLANNDISELPDEEKLSKLTKIVKLDISDNQINEMREVFKIQSLFSLIILNTAGNICLTANNATKRIITALPRLRVHNGTVITSLTRGYYSGFIDTLDDSDVTMDMYLHYYLRYINLSDTDRPIRRLNALLFSLNRTLRRHSPAEKIQSVWRGYRERCFQRSLNLSAKLIQANVRKWYNRRLQASNLIRSAYRSYVKRREHKKQQSALKIQCVWRGYKARIYALLTMFEYDEGYLVYVRENDSARLISVLESLGIKYNNPAEPLFRVFAEGEVFKHSLFSNYRIVFGSDRGYQIKKLRETNSMKPNTLIPFKIANNFMSLLQKINLCLFPLSSLLELSALFTITSFVKSLRVDSKKFRQDLKEQRALIVIERFFNHIVFNRANQKVTRFVNYIADFPKVSVLYAERISNIVRTTVAFSFNERKNVIIGQNEEGVISELIPKGSFSESESVSSLFHVGVRVSRASPSLFSETFAVKYLKKREFKKYAFSTQEECMRRISLYNWITNDFSSLFTEDTLLEHISAVVIQKIWRGKRERDVFRHLCIQNNIIRAKPPRRETQNTTDKIVIIKKRTSNKSPRDVLSALRGDYSPWKHKLQEYKEKKPSLHIEPSVKTPEIPEQLPKDELVVTSSKLENRTEPIVHTQDAISLISSPPEDIMEKVFVTMQASSIELKKSKPPIKSDPIATLSKLRRIQSRIETEETLDQTIQKKRETISELKNRQEMTKAEKFYQKTREIEEGKTRGLIEDYEVKREIEEKRAKSAKIRERKVNQIKDNIREKREKYNRDKEFAINFVAGTRRLAQKSELKLRKVATPQIDVERASELRDRQVAKTRTIVAERLAASRLEKALQASRMAMKASRTPSRVSEKPRPSIRPRPLAYIVPNHLPSATVDETSSAVYSIGKYIGSNLGYLESNMVCQILGDILSN